MIELTIPSMSWLAIVYVSVMVVNMAALRASATQVSSRDSGLHFCFSANHDSHDLVTYAVAPFPIHAIAVAIWFESCPFLPILFLLEDRRFSRRSTRTVDSHRDASLCEFNRMTTGTLRPRSGNFSRGSSEHHDGRSLVQTTQERGALRNPFGIC